MNAGGKEIGPDEDPQIFFHVSDIIIAGLFSLPVVIEPGGVARYNDVMGLLRHVVLVKVRAFYRFTLHTRGAFLLLLF